MEKVTVIVPVYKVEIFLAKCVDSILRQTYSNLEVLLVDDGSPDRCGEICDEYAAKDPRVRVIHKENGGLSSARNAGLDVATGEYVVFIDSDDYIESGMIERMLTALQGDGSDLCICNTDYVDEAGISLQEANARSPIKNECLTGRQALEKLTQPGSWFYVTAWNKLYKRELWSDLRFPEGKLHEDEFTVHLVFDLCTKVSCLSDRLYHYVQRTGSIMNSTVSLKRLDAVEAMMDRYAFFGSRGLKNQGRIFLRKAGWKLCELLPKLPAGAAGEIRPLVRLVLPKLLLVPHLDFLQLLIAWRNYLKKPSS